MKEFKKGDTVVMYTFTGMRLGEFPVKNVDKKGIISVEKKDGSVLTFSGKDGTQTGVAEGKEKYANRIGAVEDDKKAKAPAKKAEPKKAEKKAPAKPAKVEEPEDDDYEDDDYEDDDEDEDEDEE